jgi:hypothetical protein
MLVGKILVRQEFQVVVVALVARLLVKLEQTVFLHLLTELQQLVVVVAVGVIPVQVFLVVLVAEALADLLQLLQLQAQQTLAEVVEAVEEIRVPYGLEPQAALVL